MPSMRVCVCVDVCLHACVSLIMFLHKPLYLIYFEDIFTKFAENVYGYENMSLNNFVLILKNIATIADYVSACMCEFNHVFT